MSSSLFDGGASPHSHFLRIFCANFSWTYWSSRRTTRRTNSDVDANTTMSPQPWTAQLGSSRSVGWPANR